MILAERMLIIVGSAIFLLLGSLHLYYTFFSEKFDPRNPVTTAEMKKDFLRLTKQTTVWRAWTGFNASHSIGAMYFGLINIIIALLFFENIGNVWIVSLLNAITAAFFLFLARNYWFSVPFRGILIATICFVVAFTLSIIR